MTDILMVEDNMELAALIRDFLLQQGFETEWRENAEDGLAFLQKERVKLVLLDIMLPGMDGFWACGQIRALQNVPILMMSAKGDDESKILCYEIGADDYLEKPFAVPLLMAKIKALLRRSYEFREKKELLVKEGITIDYAARKVSRNGTGLSIKGKEFELLYLLMKHAGEALKKDWLFDEIWGRDSFSEPATLTVHIRWLREKLEENPQQPKLIQTIWKVGYRFGGGEN